MIVSFYFVITEDGRRLQSRAGGESSINITAQGGVVAYKFVQYVKSDGNVSDGDTKVSKPTRHVLEQLIGKLPSWVKLSFEDGYAYDDGTLDDVAVFRFDKNTGEARSVSEKVRYEKPGYTNPFTGGTSPEETSTTFTFNQAGGSAENPGSGSAENPGGGGTSDPGSGGTSDPGSGGTSDPGSGGTSDPGSGGTSDPGSGSTGNPGSGGTGNPGSGGISGGSGDYDNRNLVKSLGKHFMLVVNNELLAYGTSVGLRFSKETIDTTNYMSGGWRDELGGIKSWELSGDAHVTLDKDKTSLEKLVEAYKLEQYVTVQFLRVSDDGTYSFADSKMVMADGEAIITSLDVKGETKGILSLSVTLQGCEEPKWRFKE